MEECMTCPNAYNSINGRYCKVLEMYVDRLNTHCDVKRGDR